MQFSYRVSDARGQIEHGSAAADSREQLLFNLKAQGKFVLEIKEENAIRSRLVKARLTKQDRLNFTQQLAGLLESGIPLEKALGIMERLKLRPELNEIVVRLRRLIQEGLPFSAALERSPGLFPPLYINLVKAGETGGILAAVLKRLAAYLEEDIALQRFIISSLIYPAIVVTASFGALIFFVSRVIPRFQSTFESMHSELPLITKIVMGIGTAVLNFWWVIFLLIAGCAVWIISRLASENGRYQYDQMKLRLPLLGDLLRKVAIAKLAMALSLLNESGVSLLNAVNISGGIVGNTVLRRALQEVETEVRQGSPLFKSMTEKGVFPNLFVEMIGVGEESGNLGPMLDQVARTYEGEVKQGLSLFMATFEPILILIMVGIIAILAIAVLLPIMNIDIGGAL